MKTEYRYTSARWTCCLLAWTCAGFGLCNDNHVPNESSPPMLSPDLVPFIADDSIDLHVVEVVDVEREQSIGDTESGTLRCKIRKVLRSDEYHAGESLVIPFKRKSDPSVRAKNTIDQWNNIRLAPTICLLIACEPADKPEAIADAAIEVNDEHATSVDAVVEALKIDAIEDKESRTVQLQSAISGRPGLLRAFALDSIGRRGQVSPVDAVNMVRQAIESDEIAAEQKLELARPLIDRPFFDRSRNADPANVAVVATLASGAAKETDRERLATWIRYLGSRVRGSFSDDEAEDATIRAQLVRDASRSVPADFSSFLDRHLASAGDDDREILADLRLLWTTH